MREGPGGLAFRLWTAVTAAGVRPLFQQVFNMGLGSGVVAVDRGQAFKSKTANRFQAPCAKIVSDRAVAQPG